MKIFILIILLSFLVIPFKLIESVPSLPPSIPGPTIYVSHKNTGSSSTWSQDTAVFDRKLHVYTFNQNKKYVASLMKIAVVNGTGIVQFQVIGFPIVEVEYPVGVYDNELFVVDVSSAIFYDPIQIQIFMKTGLPGRFDIQACNVWFTD